MEAGSRELQVSRITLAFLRVAGSIFDKRQLRDRQRSVKIWNLKTLQAEKLEMAIWQRPTSKTPTWKSNAYTCLVGGSRRQSTSCAPKTASTVTTVTTHAKYSSWAMPNFQPWSFHICNLYYRTAKTLGHFLHDLQMIENALQMFHESPASHY
jgi:hypothetical protein